MQWKRDIYLTQANCISGGYGTGAKSRLKTKQEGIGWAGDEINLGQMPEVSVEHAGGGI